MFFFVSLQQINQRMRKVIGIGETILDILFKNKQPVAAVPGGSCFNSIISIGRTHTPCSFIGYAGDDEAGRQTLQFLQNNGVSTAHFELRQTEKSAISLAYLNERGDASYVFYKATPSVPENWKLPTLSTDDVMIMGSYFAICQGVHPKIKELLTKAEENNVIVFYDLNFRRSHQDELEALTPAIQYNFRHSTIVRGSADDFEIMYGTRDAQEIYKRHISAYCPIFICTAGEGDITVCTPTAHYLFPAPKIEHVVSTVGAGDNFNAGFIYGLLKEGIKRNALQDITQAQWQKLITTACYFATEACKSTNNYISREFAQTL